MQSLTFKSDHTRSAIVFFLACAALLAVTLFDYFYWHVSVFAEGLPNFSSAYLIRSVILFAITIAGVWALVGRNRPAFRLREFSTAPSDLIWMLLSILMSLLFTLLFVLDIRVFEALSVEDGPIEWGSALLLFAGGVLFFIAVSRCRRSSRVSKFTRWTLMLLFFGFFLVALEEVSWFQRVFDIGTPMAFEAEGQFEVNFHNFATNLFENAYYNMAYLFFVVWPFTFFLYANLRRNTYLRLFTPRPHVVVIGTLFSVYNFDMWNITFTQVSVFGSIAILAVFAWLGDNRTDRLLMVFTIAVLVATQAVLLANGQNLVRIWEPTEYKELMIALACFVYAVDVFARVQRESLSEKPDRSLAMS